MLDLNETLKPIASLKINCSKTIIILTYILIISYFVLPCAVW